MLVAVWGSLGVDLRAQTVAISEVGVQGYFATGEFPTRVRITASLPAEGGKEPHPHTLQGTLSVADKNSLQRGRVDHFSFSLELAPGETRTADLPVPIFANAPVLTLDTHDSAGRSLHQSRTLERHGFNKLILILCAEEKTCNEVLGTIQSSGTDDVKTRKTQRYTFLVLKDVPDQWWMFSPAHGVIVARPVEGLNEKQRAALEDYCRQDGLLILLESQAGRGLLDGYRTHQTRDSRESVGTGSLWSFRDAVELSAFLDRGVSEPSPADPARIFTDHVRNSSYVSDKNTPLATRFEFPSLPWLIVWLVVYILAVGALNFYLLTRWNRRELAWVTVPAIALLFAGVLYLMSAAKRPDKAAIDEIATYVMEDASSKATASYALRVSSPVRQEIRVKVPGSAIWEATDPHRPDDANFSIFDRELRFGDGWTVHLSPDREFSLPMLQWSYQDLKLSGVVTLPGSVRKADEQHLINETGIAFRQAIFREGNSVYDLGAVGAGATFEARRGGGEQFQDLTLFGRNAFENHRNFNRESRQDVKRLLAQQAFAGDSSFVGLAEVPSLGASLQTPDYDRKQYVVVVVKFR